MPSTVTVACKYGPGLILRLQQKFNRRIPAGGGTMIHEEMWVHVGEGVTVKGPSAPVGMVPKNYTEGGYVLTYGIDADFWEQWLNQNAEHPLVKNHLIYAFDTRDQAEGFAKDHAKQTTGLEPLDMTPVAVGGKMRPRDPRLPRTGLVLETAEKQ